ncbi:MAG: hypothetical protein R6T98_14735 [Desulfatiglandales bacterium]
MTTENQTNYIRTLFIESGVCGSTEDLNHLTIAAPLAYEWFMRKVDEISKLPEELRREGVSRGEKMPMLAKKQQLALFRFLYPKQNLKDFAALFNCSHDTVRQWNRSSDVQEKVLEFAEEFTQDFLAHAYRAFKENKMDVYGDIIQQAHCFNSLYFKYALLDELYSSFQDFHEKGSNFKGEDLVILSFVRNTLFELDAKTLLDDAKTARWWYETEAEAQKLYQGVLFVRLVDLIEQNNTVEAIKFLKEDVIPATSESIENEYKHLYELWVSEHTKAKRKRKIK